jgi:hypothetical protein
MFIAVFFYLKEFWRQRAEAVPFRLFGDAFL